MPTEVSREVAVDAARSAAATAAARDHEVSVHKNEEEKGTFGAKASWSFVSTSPAASVHPIEELDDNDLPCFHDNDLPSFHINRLRKLRFRVAANRNGNLLLKQQNTKDLEFSRRSDTSTVVEQEAAVCHNYTTAPKEDDERQEQDNLINLSDEIVVPADVFPGNTAALLSHKLSDGKLGVMSSSSIPQEQDASVDNKPPTRRDLPAEASKNANEEAGQIAAPEALNVELCEAQNLPASLMTAKSQEETDMAAAMSRESAAEGEVVVPFAHDLITISSVETEASHVHATRGETAEEEATDVPTTPTSIKDATRDISLPHLQDIEEEQEQEEATEVPTTPTSIKDATRDVSLPGLQDMEEVAADENEELLAHGKHGESAVATNELPIDWHYTAHNGDTLDPADIDNRSSQGCDSVSSFAVIHTRSDEDSSKLCERSSVSDLVDANTDVAQIPSSRSIGHSSSILASYSGSILYPGAPNHSGSISHRSDSTASNRSFAFPIFATEGNSSPARMAQPDRRYLQRKKWRLRTSCTCCSRASPTYY